jgi:hypothetical protein
MWRYAVVVPVEDEERLHNHGLSLPTSPAITRKQAAGRVVSRNMAVLLPAAGALSGPLEDIQYSYSK